MTNYIIDNELIKKLNDKIKQKILPYILATINKDSSRKSKN